MSVRYKSYAEYNPSGVEWCDGIPKNWNLCPFKRVISRNDGGVWGNDPKGENDTVVLRSTDQTVGGHWKNINPALRSLNSNEKRAAHLKSGDLLVTKSSGSALHIGKTTLVNPNVEAMSCCFSNFMQRIRLTNDFLPKFSWYLLNNTIVRRQFSVLSSTTTGLANLNGTVIGEAIIPRPPLPEQRAIAAFLDRETGKIDRLIGKQERMIQLLKEKRQAVISHAVSARKDDKQAKLAFFVNLLPGYAFKSDDFVTEPTSTKLLRGVNVGVGHTKWDDAVYFEDDTTVNAFRLKAGDLVLGMDRPWIKDGARIATISDEDLPCLLVQRVARLRAVNGLQQDYLRLQMQSKRFQNYVETDLTGVSVPHLSPDQIMGVRIPVLTDAEQNKRVGTARRMEEKFHQLTAKSEQAIELMKERRTALISAAVTGKINAREAV